MQRKWGKTISQPFDGDPIKPKETITVLTHKLRISCNPNRERKLFSLTLVGLVLFCFPHFSFARVVFVRDDNVYCEVHFSFPCTLTKCSK